MMTVNQLKTESLVSFHIQHLKKLFTVVLPNLKKKKIKLSGELQRQCMMIAYGI